MRGNRFSNPIRLAAHPQEGTLYLLQTNGDIHHIGLQEATMRRVFTTSDHGLGETWGLDIGPRGTMYITGFNHFGPRVVAKVMRGVRDEATGERTWSEVAHTAPIELSDSFYNHSVNDVVVSPDNRFLFVNSGSRTDHGEVQDNNGTFPGVREVGLTAIALRIPIDADELLLPNDREALRSGGYLFAEGLRNSFSFAFAPNGDLFATENGPNRDMPEEINWLREGHHYGFPWRMGALLMPQQFAGYDPDEDPLLLPWLHNNGNGLYADDPDYPPPPAGVVFTDPLTNIGPHADKFRDPQTGEIMDASDSGLALHTLTPHRSPLGLVFDVAGSFGGEFRGDGFVLAWTGADSRELGPLGDPGQDLCHLELTKDGDRYTTSVTRIVGDFDNPIDAAIIGNRIYVVEHGGLGLYEVTMPMTAEPTAVAEEPVKPGGFALSQNHPNPFNSGTTITFELDRAAETELAIYDLSGQKVVTLVNGYLTVGVHSFSWDGKNERGQRAASGPYFYSLSAGRPREIRKMVLLK